MTQKTHRKHTEKKPNADLFPAAKGLKIIDSPWATAAQLFPYTGLDDAALRRCAAKPNPDTGAPWVPAARGGRWLVQPTIAGANAWWRHQVATAESRSLPRQCRSMKDLETLFHIPRAMAEYASAHFSAESTEDIIFETSNRVNVLPFLRRFKPLFEKIFGGGNPQLAALTGFEDLDLDLQRAKCYQQDEIAKRRENGIANKTLHTRDGIEKELAEPLTQLAAEWKASEKINGGKLKSLLLSAGVDPEITRQAIALLATAVNSPPAKLRQFLNLDKPTDQTVSDR